MNSDNVKRNYQDFLKNPSTYTFDQQDDKIKSKDIDLNEGWNKILYYIQVSDYDKAYEQAFLMDDDIYLIRLMSMTGPCVNKLSQKVAFQLSYKIKILLKSEFWKVLGLKLMSDLKQDSLKIEQKQKIHQLLYQWSRSWQPRVSQETALLYNSGVYKPDNIQ